MENKINEIIELKKLIDQTKYELNEMKEKFKTITEDTTVSRIVCGKTTYGSSNFYIKDEYSDYFIRSLKNYFKMLITSKEQDLQNYIDELEKYIITKEN